MTCAGSHSQAALGADQWATYLALICGVASWRLRSHGTKLRRDAPGQGDPQERLKAHPASSWWAHSPCEMGAPPTHLPGQPTPCCSLTWLTALPTLLLPGWAPQATWGDLLAWAWADLLAPTWWQHQPWGQILVSF